MRMLIKKRVRDDLIESYMENKLFVQDEKDSNVFYPVKKELEETKEKNKKDTHEPHK